MNNKDYKSISSRGVKVILGVVDRIPVSRIFEDLVSPVKRG